MGKSLGIAAFVILLLSVPIPIAGNYVSLFAVLLLSGAALAGEKTWVVITDVIAWAKMFLMSPTWHVMMFSGEYLKGMSADVRKLGTSDATLDNLANQSIGLSQSVNHTVLVATILILAAPIAILLAREMMDMRASGTAVTGQAPAEELAPTLERAEEPIAPPAEPLDTLSKGLVVALAILGIFAAGFMWWQIGKRESGPPAEVAPAAAPAAVAARELPEPPSATSMSDPFGYCSVADTIDRPDGRYTGPEVPDAVLKAVGFSRANVNEGWTVMWRCAGGKVMACGGGMHPDSCDKADGQISTDAEREYCRDNPGSEFIPAAATGHNTIYDRKCDGERPVITKQISRVDAQGYPQNMWKEARPSAVAIAPASIPFERAPPGLPAGLLLDVPSVVLRPVVSHQGPGEKYTSLLHYEPGERVEVDSAVGGWCMVNSAEKEFVPCGSIRAPAGGWVVGKTVNESCWPKCGD